MVAHRSLAARPRPRKWPSRCRPLPRRGGQAIRAAAPQTQAPAAAAGCFRPRKSHPPRPRRALQSPPPHHPPPPPRPPCPRVRIARARAGEAIAKQPARSRWRSRRRRCRTPRRWRTACSSTGRASNTGRARAQRISALGPLPFSVAAARCSAPRRTRRTCLACRAAYDPPPRRALPRRGRVSVGHCAAAPEGPLAPQLPRHAPRVTAVRRKRTLLPDALRAPSSSTPRERLKEADCRANSKCKGGCLSRSPAKTCRLQNAAHRIFRCDTWRSTCRRAALERAFQRRRSGRRQECARCHQVHRRRCAAAVAQPPRRASYVGGACRRVRRCAARRVCSGQARIRRFAHSLCRYRRLQRRLRRLPVHGGTQRISAGARQGSGARVQVNKSALGDDVARSRMRRRVATATAQTAAYRPLSRPPETLSYLFLPPCRSSRACWPLPARCALPRRSSLRPLPRPSSVRTCPRRPQSACRPHTARCCWSTWWAPPLR